MPRRRWPGRRPCSTTWRATRTAIGHERIAAVRDNAVRLRVRGDAGGKKIVRIDGAEFIGRFLQHVLPAGFKRIRHYHYHYGLLAPAHKTRCLAQARAALAMPVPNPIAQDTAAAFMRRMARIEIECCPRCHGCWRPIAHAAPLRRSLWPRAGRPLTAAHRRRLEPTDDAHGPAVAAVALASPHCGARARTPSPASGPGRRATPGRTAAHRRAVAACRAGAHGGRRPTPRRTGVRHALTLTLPNTHCRPPATIERRFSPTRLIRRHEPLVPALHIAAAADKHYSLGFLRGISMIARTVLILASVLSITAAAHAQVPIPHVAQPMTLFANEDRDWGVPATDTAQHAAINTPTPRAIPGGRVIRTLELKALLDANKDVIVIDVQGSATRTTIPGAHWLPGAGSGQFFRAERARFTEALEKLTAGDKTRPIVFLCVSSECWLSYNASLRALETGHKDVLWYRGGTDAWRGAGFDLRQAQRVAW
jgi:PQQ-dependent catabolism-associated CXXCW motif protein